MAATTVREQVNHSRVPYFVRKEWLLSFHRQVCTPALTMWVFLNHRQFLNVFMVSLSQADTLVCQIKNF